MNRFVTTFTNARLAILLLSLWLPVAAHAIEGVGYVTDHLQLSMYAEKGGQGDKVKVLESGDVLDILETSGAYLHVRTATGEEGWVKKHYIVSDPPASLKVLELEEKLKAAGKKIESLEKKLESKKLGERLKDDYEKQLVEANQKNVTLFNEKEQLRKQLEQARLELLHLNSPSQRKEKYPAYALPLVLTIAGFIIGLIIGWMLHVRKLKKRFYGFKI